MRKIYPLLSREDFLMVSGRVNFSLRHYARGFFPCVSRTMDSKSLNRLFFPLKNPGGDANCIRDSRCSYPLRTDRMYFIPAGLPTFWRLDERLEFLSIHANLMPYPGIDLFSGCPKMLEIPRPPGFPELLALAESPVERLFFTSLRVCSLVYSLLTGLCPYYEEADFEKIQVFRKYASLIDYLQTAGSAQTSVRMLAERMGMVRETFTRHFIAETGIGPKELISRVLLSRSMDLLNEQYSIKEVSARLQFSSQFSFSRFFKRGTGLSPLNWCHHREIGS